MQLTTALPIRNRATTNAPTIARRHSVSYVVSVMWLLYVIIISYVKVIFYNDGSSVYYIQIVPMLIILFYQLYFLLKDINLFKSRINLISIYFIFTIFHYIILRSGLERVTDLFVLITGLLIYKKYPLKKKEISKLYYLFLFVVLLKILNGATVESMADKSKFNPNECATYLMLLFCISIVMLTNKKKKMYLIVAVICFALQFYFTSRGALLGCVLFFIAFVLFKAWKKTWKVKTAFLIILFLSLLGIAAAYFYSTVLFDLIGPGKIIIFGKDLFTGRQKIWSLTFDTIKNNLWFGVGSHINESTILEESNEVYRNTHNMALAVLASFGLLHFILFYPLFSYLVAGGGAFRTNRGKYISRAPIVFMGVITIMNYLEVMFFYQMMLPIVIVAYGLICNCECKRTRKTVRRDGIGK